MSQQAPIGGAGREVTRPPADRPPSAIPDVPPRWPAIVRAELARLRPRLVARIPVHARVLDVSEPPGRAVLQATVDDSADVVERYDAVVSVAGLVRFADLSAAVRGVDRLLAPHGQLWLLEPSNRPGMAAVVAGSIGALHPAVRGSHLQRDLPAVLRAEGYVTPDIERFTMPTHVWPLRPFVMCRAQRRDEAVG